jgi:hypothetical protein
MGILVHEIQGILAIVGGFYTQGAGQIPKAFHILRFSMPECQYTRDLGII